MKFLVHIFFVLCLLGVAFGGVLDKDVDHCSERGTLYRMDRTNSCKDCCCVKTGDKVEYAPKCSVKTKCQVPTPIEWDKMKKVYANKFC